MSTRPEILFPLFSSLETLAGVGAKTAKAFAGLGVEHPRDLLFLLPYSGTDRKLSESVGDITPPSTLTVEVEIGRHFPPSSKSRPYRIDVNDAKTTFQVVFFHANEVWLKNHLPTGQRRIISGKIELFDGVPQMVHPEYVLRTDQFKEIPEYEPTYHLAAGITARIIVKSVKEVLARTSSLSEWIDPELKKRENWPDWQAALRSVHAPDGPNDLSPNAPVRQRLAYDEFFAHQLTLALARAKVRRSKGRESLGNGHLQGAVLAALPYKPTQAQTRAIAEISSDMASEKRMNRLLQGDVGAGKTLVAFMALLVAVEAGGQGVMMAPTGILASQHLENLRPLAENAGVVVEILTGRDKGKEREAKLSALRNGDIDILVGTHAVFQKSVEFKDLRLAVVDEQHRFGVAQRMELGAKGAAADVLVMTATPIPRSLELAQYGDMDVSILDEKPPGRIPIKTASMPVSRLDEVVEHLRNAINSGQQAYWVCPLVEESEVMDMTAAEERFKHLRAALGEKIVGLVHGQLTPAAKDAAMADFQAGHTKVLVATTVIEVGVDVPAASIIVIERAEHFGLAQLHQLRGRVGRGSVPSTCLLLYQPPLTESGAKRLSILRETEDGFRIAEVDLEMRGAGDVIGTTQSGLPKFWVGNLEHQAGLMKIAQNDARKLLLDDPNLTGIRGQAARVLLWLMRQDQAIRLISVG